MDSKIRKWKKTRNILSLLQYREHFSESAKFLKQRYQFSEELIKRLGLEYELEGHQGCVNCLQWSADGKHLASGSDDTKVIYWDPFHHKKLAVIPTPHIGNIFSVKFLDNNDSIIATAAGDCKVIVQNVEQAVAVNPPLLQCWCHNGRVKRLATCPDQPMLFWSAGEDGVVLQYDLREPHECPSRNKIWIALSSTYEIKCLAVNPTNPNYIAIGANDCFVRLYDRRKMKLTSGTINRLPEERRKVRVPQDPNCVQYYSPGHLAKEYSSIISYKLAVTYIAFNNSGTEMLVNMGGEQIYLFDVNNSKHFNEIIVPQNLPKKRSNIYLPCCQNDNFVGVNNELAFNKQICACDYMRRASKLAARNWMGDLYEAAREYLNVLTRWEGHKQAYMGLIKCLVALKWPEEATEWLNLFLKEHPECQGTIPVAELCRSVEYLTLNPNDIETSSDLNLNEEEMDLRQNCLDYKLRYLGHCNTTTDIKEANFLGDEGHYICAGSDEGIIFVWDKNTTEIVTALWGDKSIVNCIQPHPNACFIASSGIDPHVKLWSPMNEDGSKNTKLVTNLTAVVEENQQRMSSDPFETMLANMSYRLANTDGTYHDVPTCRTS